MNNLGSYHFPSHAPGSRQLTNSPKAVRKRRNSNARPPLTVENFSRCTRDGFRVTGPSCDDSDNESV